MWNKSQLDTLAIGEADPVVRPEIQQSTVCIRNRRRLGRTGGGIPALIENRSQNHLTCRRAIYTETPELTLRALSVWTKSSLCRPRHGGKPGPADTVLVLYEHEYMWAMGIGGARVLVMS